LSGCYKMTYVNTNDLRAADQGAQKDVWRHRWLYGIVESKGPLSIDELCASPSFTQIHTEVSLTNGLTNVGVNWGIGILAGGLPAILNVYSSSTIQVWCGEDTTYLFEMDNGAPVLAAAPLSQELPEGLSFTGETFQGPMPVVFPDSN
ncbi:MAG: hypothetical protein ACI9VR_001361, partial [Cognaticolwellia sp.]